MVQKQNDNSLKKGARPFSLGCDTRLRGLRVGKQEVWIMHGLRLNLFMFKERKGSREPGIVAAPGCGVTTVGQKQASATTSGPTAMGTNPYSI